MRYAIAVLLSLLAACAPRTELSAADIDYEVAPPHVDTMPAGTTEADAELYAEVRDVWTDSGRTACVRAPRQLVAESREQFAALCGAPALIPGAEVGTQALCPEADTTAPLGSAKRWPCILACTRAAPDSVGSLMVFAPGAWWDRDGYWRDCAAHEMFHALATCSGVSDADNINHQVPGVFGLSGGEHLMAVFE